MGAFDQLGDSLKQLIGETVRKGQGDVASVINSLGEAIAQPKTLAVLLTQTDCFTAWHVYTDPPVVLGLYTPQDGEPFVGAVILRKEPEQAAADLQDMLKGAGKE